jgi:hypothetical protein
MGTGGASNAIGTAANNTTTFNGSPYSYNAIHKDPISYISAGDLN